MTEELLDFSRLQAGKFSLKPEKTDITKLIHDVCMEALNLLKVVIFIWCGKALPQRIG